jgi:hypothetical protein
MSLQTAALEHAINHFDDIWEQFTKKLETDKDYIATSLKWDSDKFTLIFGIDTDEVWEYHNRERLMLFSYNNDELPSTETVLDNLKNQLKDLQRVEQEIATSSKTVVVTYHHKGHTYTADTLLDAPWCPFYMKFRTDIPSIDDAIARMKYEHNIGPIVKTVDIVTTTDTTVNFDKYDFKFTDDSYVINHYQGMWPENQLTVIQFLENMAELKACYPYNINYRDDADDSTYNLYNRQGLAIIDAIVKNSTSSSNGVDDYKDLAQMSYINDALQDAKDANTSEPLQDIFNRLNTIVADMTISQIDNQTIIDELAQGFIKDFTEKARKNYSPFD